MDDDKDLTVERFIVVNADGNMCGSHKTEAAAIEDAKNDAGYDDRVHYVAHVIGAARPLAQPVEYATLPSRPRKKAKR